MIETAELRESETVEMLSPARLSDKEHDIDGYRAPKRPRLPSQVLRFGLVSGLNTVVDLLILNMLLLLFPTSSTFKLLAYSAVAYSLGAVNSFLLNKYWTFSHRQKTTWHELMRFALTTAFGIGWSTGILWLASIILSPSVVNTTLWANVSKVFAIVGTALVSYLGMRLWVFVRTPQNDGRLL